MIKMGWLCPKCGKVLTGELEMTKHMINDHKPSEFYQPVFLAEWKVEEEKPKPKPIVKKPKPEPVAEPEQSIEDIVAKVKELPKKDEDLVL